MNMDKTVGHQLKVMHNLIKRRIQAAYTGEHPTYMQGSIIVYLMRSDEPRYQRDVEKQFNIRRSTATGILNNMERDGYITRVSDERDARMKRIIPTDKAVAGYMRCEEAALDTERLLTKGLTAEEIETFLAIINKMKANLNE